MKFSTKKRQFGRPVGQTRGRAFMATIGVTGLVLAAITFYIGYEAAYSVPGRGYYNLKAEFKDANNLANHYEIRMSGVRAGQVLNPHAEGTTAVVDLKLDDRFKPLPVDSKVRVRLRSAVGVRYLEIIRGTSSQMLPEGGTIPTSSVEPSVALDEVLGTFDTKTRAATSQLIQALGNGLNGRGTDLNGVIEGTPKLLTNLSGVSNAITDRPDEQLGGFIRSGTKAVKGFDDARFDIVGGFKPQKQALKIFNDNEQEFQSTLTEAGPALSTLRAQLPSIDRLVSETADFAREARPAFAAAPSSLRKTTKLLDNGQKPLRDLDDTLDLTKRAVSPTLGLLNNVRPVLPTIDNTLTALAPQLSYLAPRACEIGNSIVGWGTFLNIGDEFSSSIRFHLEATRPEVLGGQAKGVLNDNLINRDPYTGPCTNGGSEGARGPQAPLPGRALNAGIKPFNRTDNLPYETDPNIRSDVSQFNDPRVK